MLLELFWSFFQVGLFAIGGGYAALPLIQDQAVNIHHWLTAIQFSDLVTISQMTPGPIAINSATFVGMQTADVPGAIAATLGCITPSMIIVSILAILYQKLKTNPWWQSVLKTLRPVVAGLIGAAGIQLLMTAFYPASGNGLDVWAVVLFAASLLILRTTKLGAVKTMFLAGTVMIIAGLFVPGLV